MNLVPSGTKARALQGVLADLFGPSRASYGGPPSANGSPDSADVPDAGHARVILDVHCPDEHGMCTACVYLAHFCWAPCPRARQAMTALGIVPMAQFGGQ